MLFRSDVPRSEVTTYANDKSGKFTEAPAAGAHADQVRELHEKLIEFIAEADDTLMEKWMDKGTLSEEELRAGLHAAVQKQSFIPLFCVSADNNVGVARLMDFIAKYGSSPVDRVKVEAHDADGNEVQVALTEGEPVCFVFKVMNESGFGDMTFFRVYSGQVKFGSDLYNADRRVAEKLGQLYIVNGKNRMNVPALNAGDIGAVVKLKDTHNGNTLSTQKRPVTLPKVTYPRPNVISALTLKSKGDEDKLYGSVTNIDIERVRLHIPYLGGGFGRRLETDVVEQATHLALKMPGTPVQLMWTREQDLQHDVYRPLAMARMSAGLATGSAPKLDALQIKVVSPSISDGTFKRLFPGPLAESAPAMPDKSQIEGAYDLPYAVAHQQVEQVLCPSILPLGYWRSVGHSYNAFFTECFVDEVAQALARDPLALREDLLQQRPRHLAVLRAAAEKAGWGRAPAPGRAVRRPRDRQDLPGPGPRSIGPERGARRGADRARPGAPYSHDSVHRPGTRSAYHLARAAAIRAPHATRGPHPHGPHAPDPRAPGVEIGRAHV